MIRILIAMRPGKARSEIAEALHGFQVEEVDSGELAIDRYVTGGCDALVIGLDLPARDGAATVRSIRGAPGGLNIPMMLIHHDELTVAKIAGELSIPWAGKNAGQRVRTFFEGLKRAHTHTSSAATVRYSRTDLARFVAKNAEALAERVSLASGIEGAHRIGFSEDETRPSDAPRNSDVHDAKPPKKIKSGARRSPNKTEPQGESFHPANPSTQSSARVEPQTKQGAEQQETQVAEEAQSNNSAKEAGALDRALISTVPPPSRGAQVEAIIRDAQQERTKAADPQEPSSVHMAKPVAGSFVETTFAALLADLAERGMSGQLALSLLDDSGQSFRTMLTFRRGVPVGVTCTTRADPLPDFLYESGLISNKALQLSADRAEKGDGSQLGILLATGAISPSDLHGARESLLQREVLKLFTLESGTFSFIAQENRSPGTFIGMSLAELVVTGVTTHMRIEQVMRHLTPHLHRSVRRRVDPRRPPAALYDAQPLLFELETEPLLREALTTSEVPQELAAKYLYAAWILGHVVFRGTAPISSVMPPPAESWVSRAEELERLFDAGNYVQAFGGATGDNLVVLLMETDAMLRKALKTEAGKRRRPLLTRLIDRLPNAGLAAGRDLSAGAPPHWTCDEAPTAGGTNPPHQTDDSHETFHSTSKQRSDRGNDETAPGPKVAELELLISEEQARHNESLGSQSVERVEQRLDAMLAAERHFRLGQHAFRRGKEARAQHAFAKALELAPQEPEFRVMYAAATYYTASDRETRLGAIEHARQAITQNPSLYLAHLFLARMLRDEGDFAGARTAYTDALAIDPEGVEAIDELHALR